MRISVAVVLALLLAGCGGGDTARIVEACKAAIEQKLGDREFRIDTEDMAAKAVTEDDGVVHVQSRIVFDPGLPREYAQVFDCRARFVEGQDAPDVISLTFTW